MITGNLVPDHATIARFLGRHERALADLFAEVLRLCDRAGLLKPGVVSIDGTKGAVSHSSAPTAVSNDSVSVFGGSSCDSTWSVVTWPPAQLLGMVR